MLHLTKFHKEIMEYRKGKTQQYPFVVLQYYFNSRYLLTSLGMNHTLCHMFGGINHKSFPAREDSTGSITWLGVERRPSCIMGVECHI